MRKLTYILLLSFMPLLSYTQDVKVNSWLDSTQILIGDQINFNIEVLHPGNLDISYPYFNDTIVAGIEILKVTGPDTLVDNNQIRVKTEYLITCFDTGFYEIPPVFVESYTGTGVLRYYSDYTALEVLRTDISPADSAAVIFDIAGPRKARISLMEILPWALLVLALVLAVFLALRYFGKRKKQKTEDKTHLPAEPIHIIALRDLDKLEKKELWQKAQFKKYYSKLTEILRTYIDRRYGISSLEMTSSETLQSLLDSGFEKGDLFDLLRDILTIADLTKFAKHKPAEAENINAISATRQFVKRSYQQNGINDLDSSDERGEEVSDG